jgi:U3 small nucleolar RNA-associated protein 18
MAKKAAEARAGARGGKEKKGGAAPLPSGELFVVDRRGDAPKKSSKAAKKKAKKEQRQESGPTEHELEELLFGAATVGGDGEEVGGLSDVESDGDEGGAAESRFGGEGGGREGADVESDGGDGGSSGGGDDDVEQQAAASNKPVWHDEDDDELEVDIAGQDRLRKLRKKEGETVIDGKDYQERLKQQFGKTAGAVSWATRKRVKAGDDDGDFLLRSTGGVLKGKGVALPQLALDVERMSDANQADVSDSVIQSVRFHPTSRLMLTAGLDKRLKLFQIDGKKNGKVQSVFFSDLPISSAEFSADGTEVFLTGRRKHFYTYDLAAAKINKIENIMGRDEKSLESMYVSPDNKHVCILGNCGKISLISRKTKMWISDLKMNHDARAAAFSGDGHTLYTGGSGGLVYVWDLRMRRCMRKIQDEGSVGVSAIALAPVGNLLAVGSTSGVVNTYDTSTFDGMSTGAAGELRPESRKAIMNLTTRIDALRFNQDSQVRKQPTAPSRFWHSLPTSIKHPLVVSAVRVRVVGGVGELPQTLNIRRA